MNEKELLKTRIANNTFFFLELVLRYLYNKPLNHLPNKLVNILVVR